MKYIYPLRSKLPSNVLLSAGAKVREYGNKQYIDEWKPKQGAED